jgi:hypothetical protein
MKSNDALVSIPHGVEQSESSLDGHGSESMKAERVVPRPGPARRAQFKQIHELSDTKPCTDFSGSVCFSASRHRAAVWS